MISKDILAIRDVRKLVMKRETCRERSIALRKLEEAELWLGKLDRDILSRNPDAPITGLCRFCDNIATLRRKCGEIHGEAVYENVCADCFSSPPTTIVKKVASILEGKKD